MISKDSAKQFAEDIHLLDDETILEILDKTYPAEAPIWKVPRSERAAFMRRFAFYKAHGYFPIH